MNRSSTVDPADVTEPVARALDTLIVGAAASFGLSVVAVFATAFAAEGHVHAVAHLALPGLMALIVVARAVQLLRRRPGPREDAWTRAAAVSASDCRLARVLSIAVPLAWVVGGGAILVRHAPGFHDLFTGAGIADALDESDSRFREYWRNLGLPR